MASRESYPDFIVVGAQKCGTTALYAQLAGNPSICLSTVKEVHYFDLEENYAKGENWYRDQFECASEAVVGEVSPMYLFLPYCAERIHAHNPNAKIVAIVRNPIKRAWSHYWHERSKGREPLEFEDAIEQELERTSRDFEGLRRYSYVQRGMYWKQLQSYRTLFEDQNIHVVVAEEFYSDPQSSIDELCTFLGVPPHSAASNVGRKKNQGGQPRSRVLSRIIHGTPLHKIRSIKTITERINKKDAYPEMNVESAQSLGQDFQEDARQLGEYIGKDLVSLWGLQHA